MNNQEQPNPTQHKSGFVNLIGKPNVGKSTLMNALVGEKLSIITPKAQTTRQRIMGIVSHQNYQIIYSDTPGIIQPKYELHHSMMQFVRESLEDADVILWLTDLTLNEDSQSEEILELLKNTDTPVLLLLNKKDLAKEEQISQKMTWIKEAGNKMRFKEVIPLSALKSENTQLVLEKILENLPEHPPYFPEDELTDKSERFFASEIIREKIFMFYLQEIPYSCEVIVNEFKDKGEILVIRAEIWVERKSQKGIVIGKDGEALKKLGIEARKDLEAFFGKKVFLEQFVKVAENWRRDKRTLHRLGYFQ